VPIQPCQVNGHSSKPNQAYQDDIKPFKDEVLFGISPLEVFYILLGQPYSWKRHVVYESRPPTFIINLGRKFYRILEVAQTTPIYLISDKKYGKVISHTKNLFLLQIHAHSK
jgi:hypothetical protein